MLKSILNLGTVLNRNEQKSIIGGSHEYQDGAPCQCDHNNEPIYIGSCVDLCDSPLEPLDD